MSRRDRQRRRRRNQGSPLGRIIALGSVLAVSVAAIAALAIAGWVVNKVHAAPSLPKKPTVSPGSPSEVYAGNGSSMGYIWSPDIHRKLTLAEIPQRMRQATIAIEDRRFYEHGALDYEGIIRAAIKDALHGSTALQGASTLTQQVVDNAFLPKSLNKDRAARNLTYKIGQAKLAEQLETHHSKNWILNEYLNVVPYGTVNSQTAYGVGAAAEMFFDKSVGELTLDQEALLAGMPQAPSEYNPFKNPKLAKIRRNQVLQAMVTAHYISQAQANRAMRRPLGVKADSDFSVQQDPYVFNFIEHQAGADLCPGHADSCKALQQGLKIYTTLNLTDQAEANQAIRDNASNLAENGGPGTGAGLASVQASNGHILALGTSGTYGRGPGQTTLNYGYQASRQTGSAFKVFALMTLIHDEQGNPNSTYYTSKALAAGWTPLAPTWSVHTDDDVYSGNISITHATTISDNTVFAQLAVDLGNDKINAIARAMGITAPLGQNPSEVLGALTYGTTPLQMADAYATIADGGIHHPPTIIDKIVFPDGSVRTFGNNPGTRVFPYDETYAAEQVLKTVISSPGGTGAGLSWGCPVAGKTGTAENLANAWFVGFNPQISTGVWVGNPSGNVPLIDGFGGVLAGPIWKDYMEKASDGYCGDWSPPSVPFDGSAFIGPHTSTGAAGTEGNSGNDNGTGTTGTTGTGTTGDGTSPTTPATPTTPTPTKPTQGNGPVSSGGGGGAGLPGGGQ